jgi:hydrogenase nickel incorporation protein HypA/HybF
VHELSIAQSLVEIVLGQMALHEIDGGAVSHVSAVQLRIGVLSSVAPAALRSAFRSATHATPLAGARLDIELIPVAVWCDRCGDEKTLADPRMLRCPDCGQRTPDLRRGLELEVKSVELTEEPDAANPGCAHADSQEK